MSTRNTLRFGSLADVQSLLEERTPANMDEVRAVLMNLVDHARATDNEITKLCDLLGKAGVIPQ